MWVVGIKLRLPGLHGKLPYLLGHLASPSSLQFITQTYKSMNVVWCHYSGSSADLLLRQMGLGRLKELEKRRQVGGA